MSLHGLAKIEQVSEHKFLLSYSRPLDGPSRDRPAGFGMDALGRVAFGPDIRES